VRSELLAPVFLDEVFKNLAEHLRVNSDFLFQWLGFVDGEVVAVEHVEDTGADVAGFVAVRVGEEFVGQNDVGLAPVLIGKGLEETAVEEGDAAFEVVAPRFMSAVGCQRIVKERFEDAVEEIVVRAVVTTGEPPEEIMRASAPVLSFGYAKPPPHPGPLPRWGRGWPLAG